jgi:hypothetical protein
MMQLLSILMKSTFLWCQLRIHGFALW